MAEAQMTPLGAVTRGVLAAAVGTLAMDLVSYWRYQRGGGQSPFAEYEFALSPESWEQTPAPAQVGKRLFEGLFQKDIPLARAALVNNLTHWGYGISWGTLYGLIVGSRRRRRVLFGLPYGAAVWSSSYVILPAAKLYQPIWKYDAPTLTKDLGTHLVYGLATSTAFAVLALLGVS